MKIGILTSGGDAPGMNAFVSKLVSLMEENNEIVAFKYGYQGLIDGNVLKLTKEVVSNIAHLGGSVFKRIFKENKIIYPAKLIDNLGLKGAKIKDAEISTKHAGFIVNKNNATAKEVKKLISKIKKKVKRESGQFLEEEIVVFNEKKNGYFWRLPHPHPIQSRQRNCFRKCNSCKTKRS